MNSPNSFKLAKIADGVRHGAHQVIRPNREVGHPRVEGGRRAGNCGPVQPCRRIDGPGQLQGSSRLSLQGCPLGATCRVEELRPGVAVSLNEAARHFPTGGAGTGGGVGRRGGLGAGGRGHTSLGGQRMPPGQCSTGDACGWHFIGVGGGRISSTFTSMSSVEFAGIPGKRVALVPSSGGMHRTTRRILGQPALWTAAAVWLRARPQPHVEPNDHATIFRRVLRHLVRVGELERAGATATKVAFTDSLTRVLSAAAAGPTPAWTRNTFVLYWTPSTTAATPPEQAVGMGVGLRQRGSHHSATTQMRRCRNP